MKLTCKRDKLVTVKAARMTRRKNPAAVALGRMGRGVKRQFTPEQIAAAAERLAAGRAKRWPQKTETLK